MELVLPSELEFVADEFDELEVVEFDLDGSIIGSSVEIGTALAVVVEV